jgi:hypothetical protein
VAAFVLAACERLVTHQYGTLENAGYDQEQFLETGNATYDISAAHAYSDSHSALAHYEGTGPGTPPFSRAHAGFTVDVPEGGVGTAAAAFYFPVGTFTGPNPGQEGRVDIMRWDGPENTFGMIRIAAGNHIARLMLGKTGVGSGIIGDGFKFQEGCWNWLVARHQPRVPEWPQDHRFELAQPVRNFRARRRRLRAVRHALP